MLCYTIQKIEIEITAQLITVIGNGNKEIKRHFEESEKGNNETYCCGLIVILRYKISSLYSQLS